MISKYVAPLRRRRRGEKKNNNKIYTRILLYYCGDKNRINNDRSAENRGARSTLLSRRGHKSKCDRVRTGVWVCCVRVHRRAPPRGLVRTRAAYTNVYFVYYVYITVRLGRVVVRILYIIVKSIYSKTYYNMYSINIVHKLNAYGEWHARIL